MSNFLAIQQKAIFSDFWTVLTHFWPFYCCTGAWGGRAYLGGAGQKDLEKILKPEEVKEIVFFKPRRISSRFRKTHFFRIFGLLY